MMRSSLLGVNTLTIRNLNAYDHLICNGPRVQNVRWRRKPIWLPTAKSKVFRVPQRPVIPIEEKLELQRLHNNYRTLMNSLNTFFLEREQERAIDLDVKVIEANAQQDFEICSYANDIWNKTVAAMRQERLAKERADRISEISSKLEAKTIRDSELQRRVDTEIRKAKEVAPTFITQENIDIAIQNAIKNVVNHNVAIDLDGNFYEDQPKQLSNEATKMS